MSLKNTIQDCLAKAKALPNIEINGKITNCYNDYDITILANRYCEALDKNDRTNIDIYISALLLRFWYTINKALQKVKTSGYDEDDVFNNLYECINVACQYRAWQDPNKNTNAQACINQVISSRGAPYLIYKANCDKHFTTNKSLDESLNSEDDSCLGDIIQDDSQDLNDPTKYLIQDLIKKDKIVEAIIADNIAYKNPFKYEKKTIKVVKNDEEHKYTEHYSEFWPFQLVKDLNEIDDKYINYFLLKYTITLEKLKAAVDAIVKANNQKKYKYLEKTILTMKESFAS